MSDLGDLFQPLEGEPAEAFDAFTRWVHLPPRVRRPTMFCRTVGVSRATIHNWRNAWDWDGRLKQIAAARLEAVAGMRSEVVYKLMEEGRSSDPEKLKLGALRARILLGFERAQALHEGRGELNDSELTDQKIRDLFTVVDETHDEGRAQ